MRRMDRCSVTVDTGGPVIGYCNRTGNNSNSKKKKKNGNNGNEEDNLSLFRLNSEVLS